MDYQHYFELFNRNDHEIFPTLISNAKAADFLLANAPRLYCPDALIEETFAFRTWTMRKHIRKTEAGFLITEFQPDVAWAGKYNTINAPLFHHLREFRWLKNADDFLDYIRFFLSGEGARYSYHTPALAAMYEFCCVTGNTDFLIRHVEDFEGYYDGWAEEHLTANGLYWSVDDREGTEFSISGTTPDLVMLKGFRPLMNACMYADGMALAEIEMLANRENRAAHYRKRAKELKQAVEAKLWDGEFYKAVHPLDQDLDRPVDWQDIPEDCNARELMSYIPWACGLPAPGKEHVFAWLKDETVFKAKTGLTTADISHPRFLYGMDKLKACTWSGKVWPFATSLAINAVITLLNRYDQDVLCNADLYEMIRTYAQMHYLEEDGKRVNFIDEAMMPFEHVWVVRESLKEEDYIPPHYGGKERGRDYNHSTFIDLVLRGLCGIDDCGETLTVCPKIGGIWKWFKLENLSFRKKTYTVYYDEDGSHFGKGQGITVEEM